MSTRRWIVTWVTAALYTLAGWLIGLPWTIYTGFWRERQYDLMSQSFGAWFGEALTSLAISLLVAAPLVIAIYAAIRRAPRWWWAWATGVVGAFLLIGVVLGPVFIAPLFNRYTEMPASPLRARHSARSWKSACRISRRSEPTCQSLNCWRPMGFRLQHNSRFPEGTK